MTARRCEKCFKKHSAYYSAKQSWLCKECAHLPEDKPKKVKGKK